MSSGITQVLTLKTHSFAHSFIHLTFARGHKAAPQSRVKGGNDPGFGSQQTGQMARQCIAWTEGRPKPCGQASYGGKLVQLREEGAFGVGFDGCVGVSQVEKSRRKCQVEETT